MVATSAEHRVTMLEKELAALREEYQDFVYLVSHDLQAPFRSIIGFSRLIQENDKITLDERAQKHFSMVIRSGEKGQAMVDALLHYSRIHTQAVKSEDVDMGTAVKQVLKELDPQVQVSGAIIDHANLPTLSGDRSQLLTLLRALLENSLKFRSKEDAPRISITADKQGRIWWFTLADNGIGIEEDCREKVFEVFRRLHPEQEYPGIGMGLPLARRIVERHGGTIAVSPEKKAGTKILFSLPA